MTFESRLQAGLKKTFHIPYDENDALHKSFEHTHNDLAAAGVEGYCEEDATVPGWLRKIAPSRADVIEYPKSLFPFIYWIPNYNLQWLYGDLVAGITVGAVVVPQSMAYAQLAELPVEYGLYSSFMGVLIYFFFATSKDITIGVSLAAVTK